MIAKIKIDFYAKMIYHSANFEQNKCIPSKVRETILLPWSLLQQQTAKMGHNLAKILWVITNIELNLCFTLI